MAQRIEFLIAFSTIDIVQGNGIEQAPDLFDWRRFQILLMLQATPLLGSRDLQAQRKTHPTQSNFRPFESVGALTIEGGFLAVRQLQPFGYR
uniref:hypothetical protein n=1 Tax=Vibrio rotiferianus TaxID=190895 RepID=UPI001D1106DE|nr:hypothetical protein [Vibrio rotiferianus]